MSKFRPALLSALVLAALASCGPVVQVGGSAKPPKALYTLNTKAAPAATAGISAISYEETLGIDVPTVPGTLQTLRIPVEISDTAVQYLEDAQWSEQPNRLFRRLLADTAQSAGIPVVDLRSSGMHGGKRLSGQILAFGVDLRRGQEVRIRYDATLVTDAGMRQRSFERTAPISAVRGAEVADTLNRVANEIAADVRNWLTAG